MYNGKNCLVLIDLMLNVWCSIPAIETVCNRSLTELKIQNSELKAVEHTLYHILKSICLKWRWEITMNQSREEKSLAQVTHKKKQHRKKNNTLEERDKRIYTE